MGPLQGQNARLGHDQIKGFVGGFKGKVRSLLRGPCETDGKDRALGAQRLQAAVVKPPAMPRRPPLRSKATKGTITIWGVRKVISCGINAPKSPAIIGISGVQRAKRRGLAGAMITGTATGPKAAHAVMAGKGSISLRMGI